MSTYRLIETNKALYYDNWNKSSMIFSQNYLDNGSYSVSVIINKFNKNAIMQHTRSIYYDKNTTRLGSIYDLHTKVWEFYYG